MIASFPFFFCAPLEVFDSVLFVFPLSFRQRPSIRPSPFRWYLKRGKLRSPPWVSITGEIAARLLDVLLLRDLWTPRFAAGPRFLSFLSLPRHDGREIAGSLWLSFSLRFVERPAISFRDESLFLLLPSSLCRVVGVVAPSRGQIEGATASSLFSRLSLS